ncbi:MAG TPA: ribosome-associated translation inhibitor RaiA [Chloroflexi bacterium]|nr:ribosome-associated translation inhibitor RaiA [Chloroflexota bacterium]
MEVQLFAHNLEITPRLREYVEKKVGKLDRYLDIDEARVDLAVENTRSSAHRQVAQLTVRTRGTILRAEERAADMFVAIDAALDKMRRQVSRYKRRRQDRRQRSKEGILPEEEETEVGKIVRVKRFEVVPMTPMEAVEQMELLGHQFFVFFDPDEGGVGVVYRRRDGNYGLIVPRLR